MAAVDRRDESAVSPAADDRCELLDGPLPVDELRRWVGRPDCGAVVVFTGNARDHSEGRPDVTSLAYEAYEEQAVPRLRDVAAELHRRFPEVGRVALVHRTGEVPLGEEAVVVAVAAPHRAAAFEAARFGIDAVKASVPVWKQETWAGGTDWGADARPATLAAEVPAP